MATINGTNSGDSLYGTTAADIINGLNGNDTLKGFGGADRLDGGAGIDTVFYGDFDGGRWHQPGVPGAGSAARRKATP